VYDYAPNALPDGQATRLTRGSYSLLSNLDGLGRVVSTADSEGVLSETVYDAMQNATFKSYPYDGSKGAVGELMAYDGLGRLLTTTEGYRPANSAATCDGDGVCSVVFNYYGNCTETIVQRTSSDSLGTWRCNNSYGDPKEGRLTAVGDAMGSIWRYAYNTAGKLLTVTAPLAQGNRTYAYDGNQFLRVETTPESGTVTYTPNAIGQVTSRTDARKVASSYQYNDPLSRLTNVNWQTADDVTKWYDEANNLKHVDTQMSGAFDYQYDEVNRVQSLTWTYPGTPQVSYTTSYVYDGMGCLQSMTYPTGTTLTMTCDGLNRVTSVSIKRPGGTTDSIVSNVTYHPSSQPATYDFGNRTSTTITYDDHARVWTLTTQGSSGAQNVAGLTYGYDGASNVVSFDNSAELAASRTMIYDALDRLSSVFAQSQWGTINYSYDELGNLTAKWGDQGSTSYTYDQKNRLASATSGTTNASLTWDSPGRLATSSDGSTYVYDAGGRRIRKNEPTQSTIYHYDARGRVIAETLPDGTKLRDYVYLGNKLVAVDGCISTNAPPCTERQWYHTDALGSVLARTDTNGNVVAQFDYLPWGERWSAAGVVVGAEGDRQYNGRVYDPGTGFHDYGARLYWPQIGRFISSDRHHGDIANPASLNRYSYVHNNPYKYTDPTGHFAFLIPLAVVLVEAAADAALATAALVGIVAVADVAVHSDATLLPDAAWDRKAPKVGPPGQTIDWERYNPKTDELEKSKVDYDEYGRQKTRTDYTDHGRPTKHDDPHHHDTTYGPGKAPTGEQSGPKPGPASGHPQAPPQPQAPQQPQTPQQPSTGG
jgi:RHS repeat-associated protein